MKIAFVDDGAYAYASAASSAVGGSGADCRVTLAPTANHFDPATITIAGSDDQLNAPTSFLGTDRGDMITPLTP